jgi:RND family efflux transporter MFP subunit
MQIFKYIPFILIILIIAGCQNGQNSHGHSHDTIGVETDAEGYDHSANVLSYTLFSEKLELFVEFPALAVGQISTFAVHFTVLENYKPVSEGALTVSIIKDGKGIRHSIAAPTSPGIFRPSLQPKEPGFYDLIFELDYGSDTERFQINRVEVYFDHEEASNANISMESGDEITFLKEQAWKAEFEAKEVKTQPFHSIIKTSSRVKNQPQSEIAIISQASGSIQLLRVLGESVRKGDLVALVSGSGLENNISLKLNESRINFEKSKADYIRSKPLFEKQVISEKDYLEINSRYQQDSLRFYQMTSMISENGLKVLSPITGFISYLAVSNGDFLGSGQLIGKISGRDELLIEAYVNQSDYLSVHNIFDAHFKIPSNDRIISLQELKGRLISNNVFVGIDQTRIPVTFQVSNNGFLIQGMFLETYLMSGKKENAIIVPLTSIIEEQGLHYVYVQTGGESFVKRHVSLGNNDGLRVEINEGLDAGERVVTKGAYHIKLTALAGDLPLHGHTH